MAPPFRLTLIFRIFVCPSTPLRQYDGSNPIHHETQRGFTQGQPQAGVRIGDGGVDSTGAIRSRSLAMAAGASMDANTGNRGGNPIRNPYQHRHPRPFLQLHPVGGAILIRLEWRTANKFRRGAFQSHRIILSF